MIFITNTFAEILFDLVFIVPVRIFPTVLVSTVIGYLNVFSRITLLFMPVVARLPQPIPLLFLTIYAIIAAISSQLLQYPDPEH